MTANDLDYNLVMFCDFEDALFRATRRMISNTALSPWPRRSANNAPQMGTVHRYSASEPNGALIARAKS